MMHFSLMPGSLMRVCTPFIDYFTPSRIVELLIILVVGVTIAALLFAQKSFMFRCLAWVVSACTVLLLTAAVFSLPTLRVFTFGMLLLFVIIYQQELRELVIKITGVRSFSSKKTAANTNTIMHMIDAVAQTAVELSRARTGGLIVLERRVLLDEVARSGIEIDAKASPYLLRNIFFDKAPLHDGAVLVRNARVAYAACILPLTVRNDIDQDLGTRHRAAIGMSEASDAIVIVVSEETGIISVAFKSELTRDHSFQSLHTLLTKNMLQAGENVQERAK